MKATIQILAVLSMTALSACAGAGAGGSDSNANVNGKSAADYFAQFQIAGSPESICVGHQDQALTVNSVENSRMRLYLFSSGLAHVVLSNRSIANFNWSVQGTDLVVGEMHFTGINNNGDEALMLATGGILHKSTSPWSCLAGTGTP